MNILFNFYLSRDCSICPDTWDRCKKILIDNKIKYNVNYFSPGKLSQKEINDSFPLYSDYLKEEMKIRPEAFPAMAFLVSEKFYIIYGSELDKILKNYVKLGEQEFIKQLPKT